MKTSILITSLAALSLASCASHHHADTDRDSQLSKSEFVSAVQKQAFSDLDTDADGSISVAEWQSAEDVRAPMERFNRRDANGDRKLTMHEFAECPHKKSLLRNLFHTVDANEDGFIPTSDL